MQIIKKAIIKKDEEKYLENPNEKEKDKKNISKNNSKDIEGYGIKNLKDIKCNIVPNKIFSECDNI